ncbi:GNAT family N-acetyltransferase [Burkholderia glumae]|uniref:GNAT family N-acetyltransferase n=2 Tax=Burkholderia glumae TaxID=337 RepID=A0AAP9XYF7_BURGL|nr:GNAT family N-acetyltransferase [Burkholderia glumae]ACR31216.1 GCN5-like N-acetyltransferase [Burkholderia glumae BGR1]AJY64155.1 acetyltransferase domain protein [Burkholderia glumae LMG 2196 = ATCC 33617]KHJ64645.1 acetyltransferase [Burkholderia glumae]MCM2483445.1 GNAT family N-acetyltransferase [Burkholderia glumae]MCM2511347.1 GNAT family N-acetyltransferase [Burkholderia glumae]
MMSGEIRSGGVGLFHAWERQVLALYMDAFTTGPYAGHYLDEAAERGWIYGLFTEHAARCHLWVSGDALAGFLLSADSGYDRKLPASLRAQLGEEPATSIAELAVAPGWRSRGLGEALVGHCLGEANAGCRNVIVRSNANALAAHRLYLRLGFEPFGSVRVPNDMLVDGRLGVEWIDKQYFRHRMADSKQGAKADACRARPR